MPIEHIGATEDGVDIRAKLNEIIDLINQFSEVHPELAILSAEENDFDNVPLVGGDEIVSSGSGANGSWSRTSSGLQICNHTLEVGRGNVATANVFITHIDFRGLWTFPQPFVSPPSVSGFVTQTSGRWLEAQDPTSTSVRFYQIGLTNGGATPSADECRVIALGLWK